MLFQPHGRLCSHFNSFSTEVESASPHCRHTLGTWQRHHVLFADPGIRVYRSAGVLYMGVGLLTFSPLELRMLSAQPQVPCRHVHGNGEVHLYVLHRAGATLPSARPSGTYARAPKKDIRRWSMIERRLLWLDLLHDRQSPAVRFSKSCAAFLSLTLISSNSPITSTTCNPVSSSVSLRMALLSANRPQSARQEAPTYSAIPSQLARA
jgi:hypothetical protein